MHQNQKHLITLQWCVLHFPLSAPAVVFEAYQIESKAKAKKKEVHYIFTKCFICGSHQTSQICTFVIQIRATYSYYGFDMSGILHASLKENVNGIFCLPFSVGQDLYLFKGFSFTQPGVEPGDVILVLQQKDHELFTRQGDDLFMTKKIHLAEALCGFHMVIKHLDKRNLVVKYPAGQVIEPGQI